MKLERSIESVLEAMERALSFKEPWKVTEKHKQLSDTVQFLFPKDHFCWYGKRILNEMGKAGGSYLGGPGSRQEQHDCDLD